MSFARWGDGSDVYVYADVSGGVVCCGCNMAISIVQVAYTDYFGIKHEVGESEWFGPTLFFHSVESLVEHLQEHRDAGQLVPNDLFRPDTYTEEDFAEVRR